MNMILKIAVVARAIVLTSLLLSAMQTVAQDAQFIGEDTQIEPDAFPEATEAPGNPYRNGSEGTWRVKRSYVLQVDRVQTRSGVTDNVNLRTDGAYEMFHPFWNLPNTQSNSFWRITNQDKWTFTTQINHFNPFGGFVLETVNPLGIYSSSLYGFNNTLPVAVSANARYREIGVDGFEDYMYGLCANRHFSFQNTQGIESKITTRASHTGRYSLKVAPKETLYMLKNFVPCESDYRQPVR